MSKNRHLRDAMKTIKSSKSVYRNQNPLLEAIFERSGDPRKVLCVALDYAKSKHLALCCDGNGAILRKPFAVHNSSEGVAFLIEQITATARRRKIPQSNIFLGGEDEPSYVVNFTEALRAKRYLVLRVNAAEAAENRESRNASTDELDLLGIAKTLLSRRATATGPAAPPRGSNKQKPASDIYFEIREVTRSRRALVRQQTAVSNRIHALADQLFPGFLDAAKSGITPFCKASLALMRERFSAPEIARRRPKALAAFLARHGVRQADEAAANLIALASAALPPVTARLSGLQCALAAAVDLRECLERNANALREQGVILLASTPYCLLTSIPGIGFTLAAGIAGELGAPERLRPLDSLCAFAGIVPSTYQSGGPDRPASQGHTPRRCNHILKDWTVQSAQKISLYGPPELKDRIARWNNNGQHGLFAGARRYLRLVRSLVFNRTPYLDPRGRSRLASEEDRADAAMQTWNVLLRKWRTIPGGLALLGEQSCPIGFWRRLVMEARSIQLPLPARS
jgi:transposase